MQTKILLKFGLIALIVIAASVFGSKAVRAALPVEAGLGEACGTGVATCQYPFFCSSGGKCVQCTSNSHCDDRLNESCSGNNICTLPGGNNAGDLCAGDSDCKGGLKCGTRRICEEEAASSGFKKAFNYSCSTTQDCANGLFCSGGKCVQCATLGDCDSANVTACNQGVCVLRSGNPEGAWCAANQHCASGECSDTNLCRAGEAGEEVGGPGESSWMGMDLSIQDVADIINGLACWLTRIATAVMVIFLVLAGLRFMNARGDPTKYGNAKKNFQHVLIGILVIMAVYVIIATVANAVGRTDFSLIPLIC